MGGQACVLYGAAQFGRDLDLVILADPANYGRLRAALDELGAERIAVPDLQPEALARGHAVHFRCRASGVEGLRIDVMARLRGAAEFAELWDRRTTLESGGDSDLDVLSLPDLVAAKKTQRDPDWPTIAALVEIHHEEWRDDPTPDRVAFWLTETRSAERLINLAAAYPDQAAALIPARPLLASAISGDAETLRIELNAEVMAEQERDRIYWEPPKREMEAFSRAARATQAAP